LEGTTEKKSPVTPPGIDPETVRLVAQRLNHYTNPGPKIIFIPQGTHVYAKENETEKQSAACGDCQIPNKNSNCIAREVWNIFGESKSFFIP
jgi:hypothetical protein